MLDIDVVREGGAPVYGLLCFALASHPLALAALGVAFASRSRARALTLGGASLLFGLGAALVGVGGYLYGMHQVNEALMYADPESRTELRAMGQSEAMISIWFGIVSAAIPALAGIGALVRGSMLPAPREAGGR